MDRAIEVDQYNVGWVCALLPELTAARLHLDREHDSADFESSPGDDNTYVLGSIGKHDVVVATLPHGEYGISSAAAVAKDMIRSFPSLRVILMVGIGAGVPLLDENPSKDGYKVLRDIRLGDIVVSAPQNGIGGVLQPDLGKALPGGDFQRTGHLNQPPRSLLTAIQLLTSDIQLYGQTISDDIANKLQNKPGLKQFRQPDAKTDRLFRPWFIHAGSKSEDCAVICTEQSGNLVDRPEREFEPHVHYGLIASTNTLVKDAALRDSLGTENDILCIEMEAAGLMNQLPVLVIRGICDYADSHKNDAWQGYAAMTAAAYARMLLLKATPARVGSSQKLSEISGVREQLQDISGDIKQSNVIQQELLELQRKRGKVNLQEVLTKAMMSPGASIHSLPEEYRKDVLLSMQILIYSKAPISKEELTEAVAVTNYRDPLAVLEALVVICGEVMVFTLERKFPITVTVPRTKVVYGRTVTYNAVETRYPTVKEFVLMKRKASASPLFDGKLEVNVANSAVATACLTCLLTNPERTVSSPFRDYSVQHWTAHYEAAVTPNADLRELALRLLTADHPAFQALVAQYPFPNWVSRTTCCCPLFLVALEGVSNLVHELLHRDDSHKRHACSALLAATSKGNIELVQMLLTEQLGFREQALDLACKNAQNDIADLLRHDRSHDSNLPVQNI